MSLIYAITFYPLELAYKVLYTFSASITGHYGTGLLCLSIVSTILFIPLKNLAATLQDKETAIQKVMAPQLAAIKAQSTGAIRQARIQNLYSRYAYNPLLALRSSFGILLQVPFLCAAYYMISAYTPLQGQSWGIIADLSKPDALLGGINALPILMTLFNLGALYTASGFSRKDHIQGVIVALLFLLLLYPAPSALLVYWTGNNALLLVQNIWPYLCTKFKAKHESIESNKTLSTAWTSFYSEIQKHILRPLQEFKASSFKFAATGKAPVRPFIHFVLTASCIFTFFFICSTFAKVFGRFLYAKESFDLSAPISCLAPAFFSLGIIYILIFIILRQVLFYPYSISKKVILCLPVIGAIYFLTTSFFELYNYSIYDSVEIFSARNDAFYMFFNSTLLLLAFYRFILHLNKKTNVTAEKSIFWSRLHNLWSYLHVYEERALFMVSVAILGLTVCLLVPVELYSTSPESFSTPLLDILNSILPYLLLFFLCVAVIRIALPNIFHPFLTFITLIAALVALINSTLPLGTYGSIDGPILSNAQQLYYPGIIFYDFAIILCSFICIAALFYFRQAKKLLHVLQIALVVICLTASISFFSTPPVENTAKQTEKTLFSFSKTEPNVIVFFLDMFTGGHMEEIFAARPALREALKGFVWYPDTIAVADITSLSSPSLLGGTAFTPDKIDADKTRSLNEKYTEALALLPKNFASKGYDVQLFAPLYNLDEKIFAHYTENKPIKIISKQDFNPAMHQWINKIGAEEQDASSQSLPDLVLSIGLFKGVPHGWKKNIYNNGQWCFDAAGSLFNEGFRRTLYWSAVFGMLPELIDFNAPAPTFTLLYNELPHHPWNLPEQSFIPVQDPYPETSIKGEIVLVDGIVPEHLYAEVHTLEMIVDFLQTLKEQDAFDNTMIILASDHCEADSAMLNTALGYEKKERFTLFKDPKTTLFPGRPHSLLMQKNFGATAPFQSNASLMSSEDVAALACAAIGGCENVLMPDTSPLRVRKHFYGPTDWRQIEVKGKTQYDPYETAIIKGSMFKKESWEE